MSYQPNVPLSGQSLGITKGPINTNFTALNTFLSVNHVPLNDSGQGKHFFVEMPNQAAKPATLVNESGLYAASVSGVSNVFFRPENQAANVGNTYQLTRDISAQIATFGTNPGWTFLPGNLILMYGKTNFAAGFGGTVNYPFSFTNPVFSLNVNALRGQASSLSITASTLSSFTFLFGTVAGNSYDIYWQVIGN